MKKYNYNIFTVYYVLLHNDFMPLPSRRSQLNYTADNIIKLSNMLLKHQMVENSYFPVIFLRFWIINIHFFNGTLQTGKNKFYTSLLHVQ